MDLWIITVNFGNTASTKSLINSLSGFDHYASIKVGIADNATTDKSSIELKQILDKTELNATIYPYKKNYYYWPAAKKVIYSLKDSIGSYPDWIIICNNDITFPDKDFVKYLSKIDKKKFPIIGPNIINPKGDELNPFMLNPLSWIEKIYWDIYFISYPLSVLFLTTKKWIRNLILAPRMKKTINEKVYAVHGSAILFSKYFFKRGGWLDDNFEMYAEELTVAEIAKKIDVPVTFMPKLKIMHNEHSNTRDINNRLLFDKAKKSHRYLKSVYFK